MKQPLKFQRRSFDEMLKELQEDGPAARGVIALFLRADGSAHFRISGFNGKADLFTAAGLLDWVNADLMRDIVK
jgi:hypothetical protein